jgi:replicative DNA helicase
MSDLLQEALEYIRKGWYVFPCREKPGASYIKNGVEIIPEEKTPYTPNGLNDASLDEDQAISWWTGHPDALIGVNAGKSGLFVIDIDKKHVNGLDIYSTWDINDSAGLQSHTPSGGMHIIFSGTGKSSTNRATGIDTRGEGGYIILPPSKIIEGTYTGEYRRFGDWSNPPGVIPDGLMGKLFPDSTTEYVRGSSTPVTNGLKKKPSTWTMNFMVTGTLPGDRNTSFFKAAADLVGCGYNIDEIREILNFARERSDFSTSEMERVLIHAFSKPRTPSIPDSIQEKIMEGGKNVAGLITLEEQAIMESAVLACMMIDNGSIPVIQDILNFDDFRVRKNQIIYISINTMFATGMKVDHLTVANEVAKESDKITLDDISKLSTQYFINVDNAVTYASIIKEKASLRRLEALLANKGKYLKGSLIESISILEKDVADIALAGGAKSTVVLTAGQAVEMVAQRTHALANGEIQQLKTGFIDYDNRIGGIYPNEMIVLAARSGEGKSALALSIVNDVSIVQNKPTAFFTLEMSTHETICRLICQLTGIPYKNVYQGKMENKQWDLYTEAKEKIAASPIYFDDGFGMTVHEIRSKIRKLVDKGITLVVIDQLEQIRGYDGMKLHEKLDMIAYDVKTLTKEFNIPIILNHQLNRGIMDRKLHNPEPILSDLNQAGEKPADQVWVIMHQKDEKGNILQSKVKLLKNRNGAKIEFAVIFMGERMLFSNPAREEDMHVFETKEENDYITSDNPYQDAVNAQNQPPW